MVSAENESKFGTAEREREREREKERKKKRQREDVRLQTRIR
jgi:hypothetical protein